MALLRVFLYHRTRVFVIKESDEFGMPQPIPDRTNRMHLSEQFKVPTRDMLFAVSHSSWFP
jgi:hypothetical protein